MWQDLPNSGSTRPETAVSYRAVTRYVQVILDLSVDGDFKSEQDCARKHCRAAGISVNKIKRRIWTPGIALAASMGLTDADNGYFRVRIDPATGVVVSIKPPRTRDRSRLKLLSERELSRKSNKAQRQQKRKPTAAALRATVEEEGVDEHA